jgi:hypothetical protein
VTSSAPVRFARTTSAGSMRPVRRSARRSTTRPVRPFSARLARGEQSVLVEIEAFHLARASRCAASPGPRTPCPDRRLGGPRGRGLQQPQAQSRGLVMAGAESHRRLNDTRCDPGGSASGTSHGGDTMRRPTATRVRPACACAAQSSSSTSTVSRRHPAGSNASASVEAITSSCD